MSKFRFLPGILRVRARVEMADIATAAHRIHERLPPDVGLFVEQVDLGQVELVRAPKLLLERQGQVQLVRRGKPEVGANRARQGLRVALSNRTGQERSQRAVVGRAVAAQPVR